MDSLTDSVCSALHAAIMLVRLHLALEQLTEAERKLGDSQEAIDALFGVLKLGLAGSTDLLLKAETLPEHYRGREIASRVYDVLVYWMNPPRSGSRAGLRRDLREFLQIDASSLEKAIRAERAKGKPQAADTITVDEANKAAMKLAKKDPGFVNGGQGTASQTTLWEQWEKGASNNWVAVAFRAICTAVKYVVNLGSGLATLFSWIRRLIVWLWAWL